jgi:hypothetical protein
VTLGQKQELFALLLGRLLTEACVTRGLGVRVGEVYRPPEMAAIYAKKGLGITKSLHCIKLAVDLFVDDPSVPGASEMWVPDTYKGLGEWWEAQHDLCRWGGRFKRADGTPKPDPYHFSVEHEGVK